MRDKQLKYSLDCYMISNMNIPVGQYWLRSMKGTTKNAISSYVFAGKRPYDICFTCDSTYSYRKNKASIAMFFEI